MVKGFGPDGPGADDDSITLGQANFNSGPTANDISYHFAPDWDSRSPELKSEDLMLRGGSRSWSPKAFKSWSMHHLSAASYTRTWATWTGQRLDVVGLHSSAARSRACSSPLADRASPW
jgi:hypothetical protein